MKEELKLSKLIQIILIICAIVAIVLIWPVNTWTQKVNVAVPDGAYTATEAVTAEVNVMQEFFPEHSQTNSIKVLVDSFGAESGRFMFHFYDKDLTLLWEADRSFEGTESVSYFTFPIKMQLHAGDPYYYTLDYVDTPFGVCYDEQSAPGRYGNGKLYYALEELPDSTAITQYNYITNFGWKKIAALDAVILVLLLLLSMIVSFFFRITKSDKLIKTNKALHAAAGSVIVAFMLFAIWTAGVLETFNSNWIDRIVYVTGILLCGFTLLYAVFQIKPSQFRWSRSMIKEKVPNLLRTLFWGMAVLACCKFVNAGSNYAQGLALREMCIWLALSIIALFGKKELWNIWNPIYAVIAAVAGFFYCKPYIGLGEPYETAVRTAIMAALWGVVIIAAMIQLLHKRIPRLSIWAAGLVSLFFVLLILFRNSNVWEMAVVVPFGLLYIRKIEKEDMNRMLQNIANGVIVSFAILSFQALLYRPFHYYMLIRYSGMFMTVTVTAVYLVLVFAVAVCKLLTAFRKSHTLKGIWRELVLLGLVCGYQFLTLSRTGILTCAAVYFVAIIIYMVFHRKKHPELWKFIGFSILAVLWFIPIVFTSSRIIPAMVNDPIIYEGELFLDSIKKGEPIHSKRYISVQRFLGLSTERIWGKADLDHITQSGMTVEEALEEAAKQNTNGSAILEESGVTINEGSISYIDDFGSEYTIETPGYSNGRLDIYRKYLKELDFKGHSAVGLPLEDGTTIVHAHNSFIQMAYDCGIVTGIVFLLFYILLGFRTLKYYRFRVQEDDHAMLPMLIFAAFGISSMVEYVFRPTIPLGFVFLIMITPLLIKFEKYESSEKRETDMELEQ